MKDHKTHQLTLRLDSLKDLLHLFDSSRSFTHLELGDVWHPSAGFIDEGILEGKLGIQEILDYPYDFKGLVHFQANLDSLSIQLISEDNHTGKRELYKVIGSAKDIQEIKNRIYELNAKELGKYEIEQFKIL